jgi:hypothetical protein
MHKIVITALALCAGALMLPGREVLARDGFFAGPAAHSLSGIRTKGWVELHRPDGEFVYIQIDQIMFVMSAKNTGAHKRARSRIQLVSGFADVRESVDEVMRAIKDDASTA